MKVTLLHFSGPPTVGGVEQTLYHHARVLLELGHEPALVVGTGETFDPRIPVMVIPGLYSQDPQVLAVKSELDSGRATDRFFHLRDALVAQLDRPLLDADALIVHNALTLHKNLALTAALGHLHQYSSRARFLGWHHDFAWERAQYRAELHEGYPWDLLKKAWQGVVNVVVSEVQRDQLARLYEIPLESIYVIPPGIDPALAGNWTPLTRRIIEELGLLNADAILLLPARITPRKNIELAIKVLAQARSKTELDIRLLITGPPGAHNPANIAYLESLQALQAQVNVQKSAHFLYQLDPDQPLMVDDPSMANLYAFADALFFPSKQEGFGIPLLEASLSRLPIYCSDIAPFHESAGEYATYFSLEDTSAEIAAAVTRHLFKQPSYLLRRKVRKEFSWKKIITTKLLPLLEGKANDTATV